MRHWGGTFSGALGALRADAVFGDLPNVAVVLHEDEGSVEILVAITTSLPIPYVYDVASVVTACEAFEDNQWADAYAATVLAAVREWLAGEVASKRLVRDYLNAWHYAPDDAASHFATVRDSRA
jgi:hypothetical protein